jgi:hypothetical protein
MPTPTTLCEHCKERPKRTAHPNCHYCAECKEEIQRWRRGTSDQREHHLQVKRDWAARNMRMRKYGVSVEQFQELVIKANRACELCRQTFEQEKGPHGPHLDHCHTTGKVRGILCGPCNRELGVLEKLKNGSRLSEMFEYLEKRK